MTMLRSIGAVVAGYLVVGISSVLFFRLSGRDPHAPAPAAFMIVSAIYGFLFSILAGYLAARIAGRLELLHAAVLACLAALIALLSLFADLGRGAVWSEIVVLLFMAPAVMLGGMIGLKKRDDRVASTRVT